MKPNRKWITPFAVVVQTVQYALAGYFLIGWLGVFTVGLMGGLVSFAMAYGSSQFNDVAKNRKPSSLAALLALMAFSPVLIGTATYLHLTNIPNPVWRGGSRSGLGPPARSVCCPLRFHCRQGTF